MLPLDHIIQLSGTASGESDLNERSRTTHGERDALLDTSRHEVVREVIRVSVGALNADTALAVHGAALGEVAHDRHASVNRRRNNSAQTPDGRVLHDRTARVLTLEEATTVVLTVDRKSTRLNSSHVAISYAVFCLKKKKKSIYLTQLTQ